MSTPPITKEALTNVLNGILASAHAESASALESCRQDPAVDRALQAARSGDFRHLWFNLLHPLSKLVDGVVGDAAPGNAELQFLLKHHRFIERHCRSVIERHEGIACCADKTRWVLGALYRFLAHGKRIEPDYTQAYTYHLPTKIFNDHDQTIAFFHAVWRLHAGRSDDFIAWHAQWAARPLSAA